MYGLWLMLGLMLSRTETEGALWSVAHFGQLTQTALGIIVI